jgi:hypothetical protein
MLWKELRGGKFHVTVEAGGLWAHWQGASASVLPTGESKPDVEGGGDWEGWVKMEREAGAGSFWKPSAAVGLVLGVHPAKTRGSQGAFTSA